MSEFLVIQGKMHILSYFNELNITFAVGQCGNQIGGELWPSILQEYKISPSQHQKEPCRRVNQEFTLNSFLHIPSDSMTRTFDEMNLSDLKKNNVEARVILN